ncbi:hypothetical protein PF002_g33066 [Phytophthora fragariae]|uniref:Uncharacterized protein n=1 Tax=Phytophthora fragariae TaxID=53985 RepID=A0A6A3DF84_9STRA|nr:hypothetical protein PF009_g30092 [Phytophthora fragariae]KAE9063361.1 hypothetical protein PF007_g29578 [Phytophthora fragariae]KAE9070820.1 hypothetical protein PF006_g29279 [Phytophthora fragariae]KAE9158587.1 hypothetical protein PF002_g33066 [Phytophthora fragariae]KAE9269391.1 hypothetical protein PF001_g29245 [Phytophthora fragariae]
MVTVQRALLSSENIDMCSFLNRNREFIDVTQCSKLTAEEAQESVPANVTVNLDPQTAMEMFESDWEQALVNSFSAHISTELLDNPVASTHSNLEYTSLLHIGTVYCYIKEM